MYVSYNGFLVVFVEITLKIKKKKHTQIYKTPKMKKKNHSIYCYKYLKTE